MAGKKPQVTITTNWQVHSVSFIDEKNLVDPACRVYEGAIKKIEQQQEAALFAPENQDAWAKDEAAQLFREIDRAVSEIEQADCRLHFLVDSVRAQLAPIPGAFEEWCQRVENAIRRMPRDDAHEIAAMWRQYLDEQA